MTSNFSPAGVLSPSLRSQLKSHDRLSALWSSFGSIYRLNLKSSPKSLILKHIDPPVDSRSESHLRKIISYRVERYFYESLASKLPASVKVANHYPVEEVFKHTTLLLEDLSPEYPNGAARRGSLGEEQAKIVLKWLAGFHATYWDAVGEIADVPPPLEVTDLSTTEDRVWQQGSYWYLNTRLEEYSSAKDDPDYGFLTTNEWAEKVARRLSEENRPGRTLLHGDLKAANIVFSKDLNKCAIYDFQYVGKGLGVVDLVYFLGTSVDGSLMRNEEKVQELLDIYYGELVAQITANGKDVGKYTKEMMLADLDLAIVDWFRHMAGWGFWGNSWVSESRVRDIIKGLQEESKG